MNAVKVWYLQQFNLLEELPAVELAYLERVLPLERYREGEFVPLFAERQAVVYFVKKGVVKIGTDDASGKEDLHHLVSEGNIFGELALIDLEIADDFAVAVEECLICPMDLNTLRPLMERYPRLNQAVLKQMGERVDKLDRRLSSILFQSSKDRVRELVADYLRIYGQPEGEQVIIHDPLSHREIARITATSRQTVIAVLKQYRNQGLIDFNKRSMWTTPEDLAEMQTVVLAWDA